MRNSGKQDKNRVSKRSQVNAERNDLDDEVDALFRLPLVEFTGARNTLAARLKKNGSGDEASLVKALAKPPISAWAVNQLYWHHREAFDQLIASGERFHKAQISGKVADMRAALDARRQALMLLSDLATSLLQDAGPNPGQNPSLDTIRRITSTLEAMSAYASGSDAPRPGRLTGDVDPPGFELFGSSIPGAGMKGVTDKPARVTPSQKSSRTATNTRRKMAPDDEVRKFAEARKAKIAAARVSLQDAKRSLTQARARAQSLEAAQKKAQAKAKEAEKHRRDAEASLEKAKAASEDAVGRARSVGIEVGEAASAVEDAEFTVEEASRELEKLFGE